MKPSLSSYFFALLGVIIQLLLWLGQMYFFPEVNIWAHFFLSLIGISLHSFAILVLTIERKSPRVSMVKLAGLITINFICAMNSIWFFVLCTKQILKI